MTAGEGLSVLIVEDDEAHAEIIRRALRGAGGGVTTQVVATLGEYRAAVEAAPPHIALMDLNLPDGRAVDVLSSPPEAGLFPILIMTSFGDEQVAVEAMKAGALDYIVKSPEAFRAMPRSVERALREWGLRQSNRRNEEQLRLSQKLEAVGRLAGGVAHDFNNLLSVIISYAAFAIDELHEGDPVRADLVEILRAGERAAGLTRQLLAFSRRQVLEPVVLSINRVVADLEGMLRRVLGEDIDIAVRLAEDLGHVEADPGQIEQVVMNLAVNARDAMPQGGKLTIETCNVELGDEYAAQHVAIKPGRFVRLSVSDTGRGMDLETRARVFEPFFTTKEKGKGTGLGLSTVYGIVKQSGGNIWVYSEPGKGASFKVYLPRVDAPVTEPQRRPPPVEATGSETVLVAEDEDAVRKLAERILAAAGYRVLSAANGGEALLLCEKHPDVELLLTDVVMPQMSGRELAERLTRICPGMKVLYMSGYTDNAIVHHGVLDRGTRFLNKPFSAAELTRKVREALDEGKGSPA